MHTLTFSVAKKEVIVFTQKRVLLKRIIPSDLGQSQKDKHDVSSHLWRLYIIQTAV